MQRKTFSILGSIALAALSVACGGDGHSHGTHNLHGDMSSIDNDADDVDDTDDITYRCRATIAPGTMNYWLDGDLLTVSSDLETDELVLTRDGSGSGLYDSWLAHVSDDGVLEARLYFVIGPDTITLRNDCTGLAGAHGVAEATSRAIITDTTLETLDEAEQEITF
jgi:hypothetical protein